MNAADCWSGWDLGRDSSPSAKVESVAYEYRLEPDTVRFPLPSEGLTNVEVVEREEIDGI